MLTLTVNGTEHSIDGVDPCALAALTRVVEQRDTTGSRQVAVQQQLAEVLDLRVRCGVLRPQRPRVEEVQVQLTPAAR